MIALSCNDSGQAVHAHICLIAWQYGLVLVTFPCNWLIDISFFVPDVLQDRHPSKTFASFETALP